QSQAALEIVKVTFNKDTVSENQSGIEAIATILNNGDATADISSITLSFDVADGDITDTLISPIPYPEIPGNDSSQVIFNFGIDGYLSETGETVGDISVSGTDATDGNVLNITSTTGDTLILQTEGSLVITNVETDVSDASQGQNDIPVRVHFNNPGQASVDVQSVNVYFNGSQQYINQILDSISVDPLTIGDGNSIAYLRINTLPGIPADDYDLTAKIIGEEANRLIPVSDSSLAAIGAQITIATPASLQLISVSATDGSYTFDSVSIGVDSVPVVVQVQNTGTATALLETLNLTFSTGTFSNTSVTYSPAEISGGASFLDTIYVDIDGVNTSGMVQINAALTGSDQNTGSSLTDTGADNVDSWRMVTPADIQYDEIDPLRVSTGQTVAYELTVQNAGEAQIKLYTASTDLVMGADTYTLSADTWISGSSSQTLTFTSAVVTNAPATLNGSLEMNNYFENGFNVSDTETNIPQTVEGMAHIVITNVDWIPTIVSQDMTVPITVSLQNPGGSNANAHVDSIVIEQLGVHHYVNQNIAGGGSEDIVVNADIDTSYEGATSFVVQAKWKDENIDVDSISISNESITVLRKAAIEFAGITAPAVVTTGQNNVDVTLRLTNSGEVNAQISNFTFGKNIGVYQITNPSTPYNSITPGDTVDYVFQYDILSNSSFGRDTISVSVNGQDSISTLSLAYATDSLFTWNIEATGEMEIVSVSTPQNNVSRGQASVPVTVIVQNNGGSNITLNEVHLNFANGNGNYSNIDQITIGRTLEQNDTAHVVFYVDVDSGAATGSDVIDANASAEIVVSGTTILDNAANITDSWTVQQRPVLQVQQFTLEVDTASTSQTGIDLSLQLRNNGSTTPT
ncbi:MAG: hypothetical protein KAR38_07845, partial [Calditrichia bacterium]|nr:hypothetical protein [Calditrichia bacterium]